MRKAKFVNELITKEEYIKRKLNKETDLKISQDLYVGEASLDRWKRANGINSMTVHKERYRIIKEMLNKGSNLKQIARKQKITVQWVRDLIKMFEAV